MKSLDCKGEVGKCKIDILEKREDEGLEGLEELLAKIKKITKKYKTKGSK